MSLLDENAEILKRIDEGGNDLTPSREVDFSHLFADRLSAEAFASDVEHLGFRAAVEKVDRDEGHWDVTASKELVPSAANVTAAEEQLHALAQVYGGYADGWGFMNP
ncbi:ribonuclease E inhibitor RraB [Sphingomonas aerophila]|uniref:Regulator of RNase E activity RraB n=1 Tax=Sphingomonas aerophila TaxID=1344948 RepID=A0A7W9BFJ7_9SPHN|nr:ribonuclease E inhibitor RraB [Sphingomonas aerophila]MBB5716251.1 regulator of RNase E activity RraB [Sphingomonas aerophila]